MRCRKCGADIPEESNFCLKCGTEVIREETTNDPNKEYKIVKCGVNELNQCIDVFGCFGWAYKTHQTVNGNYSIFDSMVPSMPKQGTNNNSDEYLMVTLFRDKTIKNREELIELGKAYDELFKNPQKYSFKGAIAHFIVAVAILIFTISFTVGLVSSLGEYGLFGLIGLLPAFVVLIRGIFHTKKIKRLNKEELDKVIKRRLKGFDVAEKAKALLEKGE